MLENANDFMKSLNDLVAKTIREHKRIIFNGNNYSDEWTKEAEKRGLLNLRSSDQALPYFKKQKNIDVFAKHGVLSAIEVESRTDIMLENYCKTVMIEAECMADIAMKEIFPAVAKYSYKLAQTISSKRAVSAELDEDAEVDVLKKLSAYNEEIKRHTDELKTLLAQAAKIADHESLAHFCRQEILACMEKLRAAADGAELLTAKEDWPFPTYSEIFVSV